MTQRSFDGLNDLGRLIFLDRYAKKDQNRDNLTVGQEVVVCVDPETASEKGQRELGHVKAIDRTAKLVTVHVPARGEELTVPFDQVDIPVEDVPAARKRQARAVAAAEHPDVRADYAEVFERELLADWNFVPGGRVLAGAGVDEKLTCYNCFVLAAPTDSRHGIMQTLDRMTEIMSRGGGVGIPLMTLRPRYSYVKGVNGRSSGSVRWGEIYSFGTGLVEQGGSRRGALMLIQYDWHPDILEFIDAKRDKKRIVNANVSVGVSEALMRAVEADGDWSLRFPDTTHPEYNTSWDGDIVAWEARGLPVRVYKTLKARDLWQRICEAAHAAAEPGVFFYDRYNSLSNSYYYARGKIWCTNPCGEQGIPPWAVCNLGHLNLTRMLIGDGLDKPAMVNWQKLRRTIQLAVRFMDDLIDIAYAPFPENDEQQKSERRIGMGTLGLGELLIRCHVRYGNNKECLDFLDKLYGFIATEAYLASARIAVEKGPFPWFDADKYLESGFMRGMPMDVRDFIRERGMRNVCVLTQAPTGTVGTMVGTSTGIEAFYAYEYTRTGRLGTHVERVSVYDEYLKNHPEVAANRSKMDAVERATSSQHLPKHFVTSMEMTPEDHVYTQAAIQRWVDSSISKTSNLPAHYTVEDVGQYYTLMYKLGCKGGTVYRDKSREEQVLNIPTEAPKEEPKGLTDAQVAELYMRLKGQEAERGAPRYELRPIPTDPYDLKGMPVTTPAGKISVKLGLAEHEPFEVWVEASKPGTAVSADTQAIARLSSLILRMDSPIAPMRRLDLIADQLEGIRGGDPIGFGARQVLSLPDGVAYGLRRLKKAVSEDARKAQTHIEIIDAEHVIAATPDFEEKADAMFLEIMKQVEAGEEMVAGGLALADIGRKARAANGTNGHTNGHANGHAVKAHAQIADICPSCHQVGLHRIEGCHKCLSCGYSRC